MEEVFHFSYEKATHYLQYIYIYRSLSKIATKWNYPGQRNLTMRNHGYTKMWLKQFLAFAFLLKQGSFKGYMLVPPFGVSSFLRGIWEDLFPAASGIAVESAACLTFGTLMTWRLSRGPARVKWGSSTSCTLSLDSVVLLHLAFNRRHNRMATKTRRMKGNRRY